MKLKITLITLVLSIVVNTIYAGNNNYNNSYAYHMGSNYNNGKGLNPVYPVKAIIYTPWVRHAAPIPEHLYRNPRAIVRNYGSFYEVCYANYQY